MQRHWDWDHEERLKRMAPAQTYIRSLHILEYLHYLDQPASEQELPSDLVRFPRRTSEQTGGKRLSFR